MAYTAIATTTAGRNGHVDSSDGVLHLDLAMPGSGKKGATNPEQLFAAGYSSCFGSAILAVAGADKLKPDNVQVTAEVTLVVNGHDYSIAVKLKAKIDAPPPALAPPSRTVWCVMGGALSPPAAARTASMPWAPNSAMPCCRYCWTSPTWRPWTPCPAPCPLPGGRSTRW
jgi:Ohr subfamily peroxiredoxin